MTKLSDIQCVLLSSASQRDDASVLPLPAGITPGGGVAKALAALTKHELAEERETNDTGAVHRSDGGIGYGLFLTPAGAAAIEVEPDDGASADEVADNVLPSAAAVTKPPSKATAVLALLSRAEGATLPELIEATGWLPHTTRAALTGLRKKGHDIERSKRDGATCYRIAGQA